MRIFLITIIILLFGSFSTSAQVFKVGVLAGLNGSQVGGDGFSGYNKLGFIVGGFTNTKLSKNWSTQFEIYFINKGSKKNANPSKGSFDSFKLNINYIEIPLVLRYHYNKFRFELGLYYSRFLSVSMEDEFGKVNTTQFPFKNYDFGGLIGLNYEITEHIMANIRFKNSILPIRDFDNLDQSIGLFNKITNRGWYNTEINFTVRYQFGNKKNAN